MSFKQKKQYTNRSDYWNTPTELYNHLMEIGYIDYNPSGSYIEPFNSDVGKYKDKYIFINPPFSLLGNNEMYETIKGLIQNNNTVVLLMPARTDTKYFHNFLNLSPIIYFIKGRLSFNDIGSAPFPTILLEFSDITDNSYIPINRKGLRYK